MITGRDEWKNSFLPVVKDELRKDKIKVEEQIELLKNKEYDRLLKKLEKDLTRINESLQD